MICSAYPIQRNRILFLHASHSLLVPGMASGGRVHAGQSPRLGLSQGRCAGPCSTGPPSCPHGSGL